MSTVTTPTAPCKAIITELYGERPTEAAPKPSTTKDGMPPLKSQQAANTIAFDTAWVHAVERVSTLAQARLPEALHGRIQRATGLVLAQGVWLDEDGHTCQVRASDGQAWYSANGSCPCVDHQRAPEHLCKHRLARGIYLRAAELLREGLPPDSAQVLCDPETPASTLGEVGSTDTPPASKVPLQYIVMIQGKPFVKFAGLLAMAHERGLVTITATWTYNDAGLSLAEAVATFKDGGHYRESGDATPDNVTKKVAPHFRRVALTRAKSRALRDALGVDLAAVEELGDTD